MARADTAAAPPSAESAVAAFYATTGGLTPAERTEAAERIVARATADRASEYAAAARRATELTARIEQADSRLRQAVACIATMDTAIAAAAQQLTAIADGIARERAAAQDAINDASRLAASIKNQ